MCICNIYPVCGASMNRVKYYFENSSIHGLHYIVEPKRHWTERVFWSIICVGAVVGMVKLIILTWYAFQNNAVSFTVETTYLGWETTFPAVSVCEHESPDKIYDFGNKLYGEDRNMNLDFYLRDIAFFDGTCYSCKTHCNKTINCTEDKDRLVEQVRASCKELIGDCKWNGEPFDCCKEFLPIKTEIGTCFSLNSLQASRKIKLLKSNKLIGPGQITFKAHEAIKVLIHAPEDVPYINSPQEEKEVLAWGQLFNITFQVKEIENDPLLEEEVEIEQRNCRFPEENYLKSYTLYSYSACIVDCRTKAQLQFCGCVHHFTPPFPGAKVCDIQGLICLTKYSETLLVLRTEDSEKLGLVCDCMSSCIEPEYVVISKIKEQNEDYSNLDYGSIVLVEMDSLPNERFKRNVVRTRLDLVVSMGGAAGLFLGASILSMFECLYYFFIRKLTNDDDDSNLQKRQKILRHNIMLVEQYNHHNIKLVQEFKHKTGRTVHARTVHPSQPFYIPYLD